MHQFFSSRKSSTPGSAAQPASERDTLVSAEQPVSQLQSLKDVQKWLATDCVTLDTTEIRRLRHAVQILANAKPKQEDIRLLQKLSNWNVTQTIKKKTQTSARRDRRAESQGGRDSAKGAKTAYGERTKWQWQC